MTHERLEFDWKASPGNQAKWKSYTVHRQRYPIDPRLVNKHTYVSQISYIGGERFMVCLDRWADYLSIYRFEGEIAIPCIAFTNKNTTAYPPSRPSTSLYVWVDGSGGNPRDGQFQAGEYSASPGWFPRISLDGLGNLWLGSSGTIVKLRLKSMLNGVPQYDLANPTWYGKPNVTLAFPIQVTEIGNFKYDSASDSMALTCFTNLNPRKPTTDGIDIGTEILKFENWSTQPKVTKRVVLQSPYTVQQHNYYVSSDVSGDYAFALDFQENDSYYTLVYDLNTGQLVGNLKPNGTIGETPGRIDVHQGLVARKLSDGSHVVFHETDGFGRVMMHRVGIAKPFAPTGFSAKGGNKQATLRWSGIDGSDLRFNIYRKTGTGAYTLLHRWWKGTLFNDKTALNGAVYTYRVHTVNGVGTESEGVTAEASPSAGAPTVSIASPTAGQQFGGPVVGSINITATAADSDGTIARVDFYNGDQGSAVAMNQPIG